MIARRTFYMIALAALLGACSDSDIAGLETTKRTAAAQEQQAKDEGNGPSPVNKCAVYRNELCDY